MAKTDVKSMTLEELQLFMGELGEPKFRAKQIFDWLHQKQVDTFAEMTNLSQKLRERLEQEAKIGGVEMVERLLSKEDGTRKYLFALENGSIIESVLMQYDYGNTVCVSTQAGCRMGCKFCASTLDGVERSLTPAEMLSQVYMTKGMAQFVCQFSGTGIAVIDPLNHGIFKCNATFCVVCVIHTCSKEFFHGICFRHRHDFSANFIVWRMKGNCQGNL